MLNKLSAIRKGLTLLLLALVPAIGFCQNDKFLERLNGMVKPIVSLNPEDDFKDILFLKALAKDATIIGLGESTHGTPLYNTYRQRLIRFLILEMGYKAIVDEGDIVAAEKLDAYINHHTDSLAFIGGLRPVVSNKSWLDWLRAYNKSKPESERVHIYGAEVRGFHSIIEKLKSFSLPQDKAVVLERFSRDVGVGYKNLTRKDFQDLKEVAQQWGLDCNTLSCSYYLSLLHQAMDFAYRQRFGSNSFNVRDNYMFENIKSTVSKTPGNKTIVLAHNGHLQKTKFISQASLGYLLNRYYGSNYYVMATDFNTGDVSIYNGKSNRYEKKFFKEVGDKNSIEYYLKQSKFPDFFLPVQAAANDTVTDFLVKDKIKMVRNMGAYGDPIESFIRIVENYDLLIFFNDTRRKGQ